jgi:hAT family C-terminal dimerisation region
MDIDTDNENFDNGENNTAMLQAELLSYRSTKVEPLSTDPLAFWRSHAGTFPHVAQQAEKLLCVTATSLPCERLFSVAGILVEKKRTSLTPDRARQRNSELKQLVEMNAEHNNNHEFIKLLLNATCAIQVLCSC